ncbi:MAG: DNA replication and repair protein RecF [Bacteroidales bacterium]|nr:MAG: DNA replication and repair protein RecF [Bacteroidales bacterium]
MFLQKLSLINFKNYQQADIEFSPKLNCFIGKNGVGKTNIFDAVYYLCLCKSYFNIIDSQNIKYNEELSVIQGEFVMNGNKEEIYCGLRRNKRKVFKRNKKEYNKLSNHIGLLPIVMISPADSNLITGGSEERRKFINGVIVQYDKNYLDDLIKYNRLISQRNKLLKDLAISDNYHADTLDVYDEQLVPVGKRIYEKRVSFAEKLVPIFQKYYDFISLGIEKVELIYQSQLSDGDFGAQLEQAKEKDRLFQFTTTGVHKDDLILNLQGINIKKNGSQGQQKTYLVALKLAKFDFIKEINKIKPVLLLDDVFDKFDESRVKQIIKLVADDNFGQILISHTSEERMKAVLRDISIDHKLFIIQDGSINENEKKQHTKNKRGN